jgi:Uma2 family endonuclease
MVELGILPDDERMELLEGWMFPIMGQIPPHDTSVGLWSDIVGEILPTGWYIRIQSSTRLKDSVPLPDGLVARGKRRDHSTRHPLPKDTGLATEVSDTTLERDRGLKQRIYARARIPVYWIINLRERQVEVYTDPTGPRKKPTYRHRKDYPEGDTVPLVLDGVEVGRIAVSDLMP